MLLVLRFAAVVVSSLLICATAARATKAAVAPFKNCTQFNKRYPHGVGRVGAHDHTSGKPVTTFLRNNVLYAKAMRNNSGLDRDKDKIACESA